MVDEARIDGRTARAQRTRAAIVEAHLNLINSGDPRPTGERIAEAAGVSLRTLWTNFKDLETLFEATGRRIFELMRAGRLAIAPDLPLPQRVDAYCRQRAHEWEILAPAGRASVLREPFSEQLRRNRSQELARVRADIVEVFATELAAAGPDVDELTTELMANSTFAVWSVLRDQLESDVDTARGVLTRSIGALLGV
jgi:AcrR family transcriptional regulator